MAVVAVAVVVLGRGKRGRGDKHRNTRGVWRRGWPWRQRCADWTKTTSRGSPHVWQEWGAGPGLGGLEGKVGLVPESSGQVQGPALRARLPEAYPACPLPKQNSVVSQPGHSKRGSGSSSWPGQLQRNWVKSMTRQWVSR